jgi:hypothetical protein
MAILGITCYGTAKDEDSIVKEGVVVAAGA